MSQHPGEQIRRKRLKLGFTQSQCSQGIMPQSTLSLIERGKMIPSATQLQRLSERLHIPLTEIVEMWEPHRLTPQVKSKLFGAAQRGDATELETTLDEARPFLSTFETFIYEALVHARQGLPLHSENRLTMAWAHAWEDRERNRTDGQISTLNSLDHRRMMVIDATIRVINYQAVGRTAAARIWEEKRAERLASRKMKG